MINPQKDPSVVPRLSRAIADYLTWMQSVHYSPGSCHQHRMQLESFLSFVKNSELVWQQLFAGATREQFKKLSQLATTAALNGLSRYLAQQGQINTPLPRRPQPRQLAGIYEDYLNCRQDDGESSPRQLNTIGRVLSALGDYLQPQDMRLSELPASAGHHKKESGAASDWSPAICQRQAPQILAALGSSKTLGEPAGHHRQGTAHLCHGSPGLQPGTAAR